MCESLKPFSVEQTCPVRLQTTISFYLFPNCHIKTCFFFFLSPNLFERFSALVVQFLFQFDQVDTWPEANHLFWGQHWSVANWFPSQLSTEQTRHPTAYPTPCLNMSAWSRACCSRGQLRGVLHGHVHISQKITLINPHVAHLVKSMQFL